MRATIDSTGTLTIVPESEIEAYALRCYQERFESSSPPAICFGWDMIHSRGDCKPSKGSEKSSEKRKFFPFTPEEWEAIMQKNQFPTPPL